MKFSEFARERKSIRGFKKDPLPMHIVDEIIETAMGPVVVQFADLEGPRGVRRTA